MQPLKDWVRSLSGANIPVLRKTTEDLQRLKGTEDSVTARELSQIVLRDPLLTLKLLRFSQSQLTRRQPTEVTTVEHVLMMHGVNSFFRETRGLVALEQQLSSQPAALDGALRVISRAWHAANFARNFAALRHDMDPDEVVTGALLHDLAELLLWCTAPAEAMQIEYMLQHQRGLRSAAAQRGCLGFALSDLQLALAREWKLPSLLQSLMDDQQANQPRVRTVTLSVAVARHSAIDWYDKALPDDYAELQKLLNLPQEGVMRWVRQSAVQAARSWRYTGVRPAATWIPLLPGTWPEEQGSLPRTRPTANNLDPNDLAREEPGGLLSRVLQQLAQVTRETGDALVVVALVFFGCAEGLGLRRLWFGDVNSTTKQLELGQTLLLDPGLLPGDLSCNLGSCELFARMLGKVQGIWFSGPNREKLAPLLPEGLREKLGARDFFAMSLHVKAQPFGLFYADGGSGRAQLDEQRYTAFKTVCLAATQAFERLAA
jgi:HD-like signal output (HDOD) protein